MEDYYEAIRRWRYLVNGSDIVEESKFDQPVSREDAAKNTMAYDILEAHNTSGNMQKLQNQV